MNKRSYVAIPAKLSASFESIAAALNMNVNELGVHCLEGCVAAIQADTPGDVPIVRHARRILRKDISAGDRLLLDLLNKTFPKLPNDPERFRELLIEETNRMEGTLTRERLQAAHAQALARWKAEGKRHGDPVGEMTKSLVSRPSTRPK